MNRPTWKVAADARRPDPFPTVSPLSGLVGRFRRKESLRPDWVPGGTMHLYLEGTPTTGCGLALDALTLFPEIDWPGGVALSNPRCAPCGERIADA